MPVFTVCRTSLVYPGHHFVVYEMVFWLRETIALLCQLYVSFLLCCCGGGGGVGVVRGVPQYGMPVHKHPEIKGNLYVEFEFEFPERLECETAEVSTALSVIERHGHSPLHVDHVSVCLCVLVPAEAGRPST